MEPDEPRRRASTKFVRAPLRRWILGGVVVAGFAVFAYAVSGLFGLRQAGPSSDWLPFEPGRYENPESGYSLEFRSDGSVVATNLPHETEYLSGQCAGGEVPPEFTGEGTYVVSAKSAVLGELEVVTVAATFPELSERRIGFFSSYETGWDVVTYSPCTTEYPEYTLERVADE